MLRKVAKKNETDALKTNDIALPSPTKMRMIAPEGIGREGIERAKVEALECRTCLESPATRRHCCGECYCHKCYYAANECPGCGESVVQRNISWKPPDPAWHTMLCSSLVSLIVFGLFVWMLTLIAMHFMTLPETVHGHTCAGFMARCTMPRYCVERDANQSNYPFTYDEYGEFGWKKCSLGTKYKHRGPICITDFAVYSRTRAALGWDFCVEEEYHGIIVFEDVTDGRPRASGNWMRVVNGFSDDTCGGIRHDGTMEPLFKNPFGADMKYGLKAFEQPTGHSLVFRGDIERSATTPELDVKVSAWYAGCEGGCMVRGIVHLIIL
jgi:hypothetical protein